MVLLKVSVLAAIATAVLAVTFPQQIDRLEPVVVAHSLPETLLQFLHQPQRRQGFYPIPTAYNNEQQPTERRALEDKPSDDNAPSQQQPRIALTSPPKLEQITKASVNPYERRKGLSEDTKKTKKPTGKDLKNKPAKKEKKHAFPPSQGGYQAPHHAPSGFATNVHGLGDQLGRGFSHGPGGGLVLSGGHGLGHGGGHGLGIDTHGFVETIGHGAGQGFGAISNLGGGHGHVGGHGALESVGHGAGHGIGAGHILGGGAHLGGGHGLVGGHGVFESIGQGAEHGFGAISNLNLAGGLGLVGGHGAVESIGHGEAYNFGDQGHGGSHAVVTSQTHGGHGLSHGLDHGLGHSAGYSGPVHDVHFASDSKPHAPSYHKEPTHYAPAKYGFKYVVKDDYGGNDFGHTESRHGDDTKGEYFVQLPDGRRQTVSYFVNKGSGYVANVHYDGKAQFPPPGKYRSASPVHGASSPIHGVHHGSDNHIEVPHPKFEVHVPQGHEVQPSSPYGAPAAPSPYN